MNSRIIKSSFPKKATGHIKALLRTGSRMLLITNPDIIIFALGIIDASQMISPWPISHDAGTSLHQGFDFLLARYTTRGIQLDILKSWQKVLTSPS